MSSLELGTVGGEALSGSLRGELADRGVSVLQVYATADVGLIAYESSAQEGMIIEESIIVEIVRPGTGDLVAEGEVGEVLVTTLNPHYPLIRFATGDLSTFMIGQSPCGRTRRERNVHRAKKRQQLQVPNLRLSSNARKLQRVFQRLLVCF